MKEAVHRLSDLPSNASARNTMNTPWSPLSVGEMKAKFPRSEPGRAIRVDECDQTSGLCLVSDFHSSPGEDEMWWVLIDDVDFGGLFAGKSVSRDDPVPAGTPVIQWRQARSSLLHDIADRVNARHYGLVLPKKSKT